MSPARKLLPNRRGSPTFDIEVNGLRFTATAAAGSCLARADCCPRGGRT
jgi:hypothetical protein